MFVYLSTRGPALWIFALVTLGVNTGIALFNTLELIENSKRVEETHEVLIQLRLVLSELKDAEIGQRGYLLTNDARYLKPYETAQLRIRETMNQLKAKTAYNADQQASLQNLESLLEQKLTELRISIFLFRFFGFNLARELVVTNYGEDRMENFRAEVAAMEGRSRQILSERQMDAQSRYRAAMTTSAVGGVMTIGLTGLAFYLIRRDLARRRATEVTLRKSTQELLASQQRSANILNELECFFANTPIGLAILSPEMQIIRINPLLAEAIGHPASTLLGSSSGEIRSSFLAETLPDLLRVVRTQQSVFDRLVHQPGSVPMEDRSWQMSFFPIPSPGGDLLGVGFIAQDITERFRNERRLREIQARFRNLAESMPQMVWVTRPDGYHEYFNQVWYDFTGLTFEESTGWGWMQALHTADAAPSKTAWEECITSGKPLEIESRFCTAAGVFRWFLARALPQYDESGRITNWFGTYTDIHERKTQTRALEVLVHERTRTLQQTNIALQEEVEVRRQLEQKEREAGEELRRSNQELEQFAYVASHDLQEPLRKIQAFADRLAQKFTNQLGEQGQEYLDRITGSATRMRNLINDLLSFSRIATRIQPFIEVDLAEIIRDVLIDLEVRIQQTGGEIDVGPLPRVEADVTQIRQLFLNLIGNALKFHRPEVAPRVTIRAEIFTEQVEEVDHPTREMCRIKVTDNGIGFDPLYSERIFQIFQRLHGRNQYEGTGIGLAICRKIIERHLGKISATSVPGEGSIFTVCLPVHHEHSKPEDGTDCSSRV